jgi:hypothetical protein
LNIKFPYQYDYRGKTATSGYEDHIREMIEQILFTSPGERPNRPSFGCGVKQLLFQPNSDELSATTQFLIQGALQQWMSELIEVQEIRVDNRDSSLQITVRYRIRLTQSETVATFTNQ